MKKFRSGSEKEFAKYLRKQGIQYDYEADVFLYAPEAKLKKYYPDFKLKRGVYIEFKGILSPEDKRKMRLIKEQYPSLDIRIVFEKDNWTTKAHVERYSEWAERNGYKWHVGISLPPAWIKEFRTK